MINFIKSNMYRNIPSLSCPSGPFRTSPLLSSLPSPPPKERVIDLLTDLNEAGLTEDLQNNPFDNVNVSLPDPSDSDIRMSESTLDSITNNPPSYSDLLPPKKSNRN